MDTLSSPCYHMEVDVSAQINHQVKSVAMESIVLSASSHHIEVEEYSSTAINKTASPSPSKLEINDYECLEILGRGGFGFVCKYKSKNYGIFLSSKKCKNGGETIKKEVDVFSKLRHENIVSYYDCNCGYLSSLIQ